MSAETIATVVKMLESLPKSVQVRVAEHLRDYLVELQDEVRWDKSFAKTQPKLIDRAREAKRQMAEGKARPLQHDEL
jgi:hypothetical protein